MHDQRTDDWFAARLGKVTASRIADVMAKTKTGPSASRTNYHAQLVAERLSGSAADSFTNAAMQWGIDTEAQARIAYEFKHGIDVTETGFYDHPAIAMSGASPDGLAGSHGLVEIKCPNTATHIATLRGGTIERKYVLQMHWQLACTGREWCDFVSFDPRVPLEMQLFVQRVPLDAALLSEIETEVTAFLSDVDEAVADLRSRYSLKKGA